MALDYLNQLSVEAMALLFWVKAIGREFTALAERLKAQAEEPCACDGPDCPGYDLGVEDAHDNARPLGA